jgi:hypothetical protein
LADLLVDGERVMMPPLGDKQYLVQSKSIGDAWHVVEHDDVEGRWQCSCVSWLTRESCPHVKAVRRWDDGEAWVVQVADSEGTVPE